MMISVVLLPDDAPAAVKAITDDIEGRWTNLPYATRLDGDSDMLSFGLGSLSVAVGRMPAPYPWSDLGGRSAIWISRRRTLPSRPPT